MTEISNYIVPIIILVIILWAVKEKKNVFELFIEGVKNGMKTMTGIIPTLIGIFFAVELLRASGVMEFINNAIKPVTLALKIPSEIVPLMIIRPISGSGALGIATNIIQTHGVDSYIGRISAVIMGATETSLYVIALYTGALGLKKDKSLIYSALLADAVGIISAVIICKIW